MSYQGSINVLRDTGKRHCMIIETYLHEGLVKTFG